MERRLHAKKRKYSVASSTTSDRDSDSSSTATAGSLLRELQEIESYANGANHIEEQGKNPDTAERAEHPHTLKPNVFTPSQ
jgi:hypothetical protein